jgi:methionine synthase II (cobalamin-independent)
VKKTTKNNAKAASYMKMMDDLKPVGDFNYDLKESYYIDKLQASYEEMKSINAGLKDIEEGRIFTQEEAKNRIAKKLKDLDLND